MTAKQTTKARKLSRFAEEAKATREAEAAFKREMDAAKLPIMPGVGTLSYQSLNPVDMGKRVGRRPTLDQYDKVGDR
jgi:hypothetical protein